MPFQNPCRAVQLVTCRGAVPDGKVVQLLKLFAMQAPPQAPMAAAASRAAMLCGLALCLAGLGVASGYPSGTLLVTEGGGNIDNATLLVVRQAGTSHHHVVQLPCCLPSWHCFERSGAPSASTRPLIGSVRPAQAYHSAKEASSPPST